MIEASEAQARREAHILEIINHPGPKSRRSPKSGNQGRYVEHSFCEDQLIENKLRARMGSHKIAYIGMGGLVVWWCVWMCVCVYLCVGTGGECQGAASQIIFGNVAKQIGVTVFQTKHCLCPLRCAFVCGMFLPETIKLHCMCFMEQSTNMFTTTQTRAAPRKLQTSRNTWYY